MEGMSQETERLAPSGEHGGSGEGAWPRRPEPLVERSQAALPVPGAAWAPCSCKCGCGTRRYCPPAATSPWCGCCAVR